MKDDKDIKKIATETLNTVNNIYSVNVYEINIMEEKIIVKFYTSFPEEFHAEEDAEIDQKEKRKISEIIESHQVENKKTFSFAYMYSDFFEVKPETL